jgi:hypothetical protein
MKYLGLVGIAMSACAGVDHVSVTPLPPDPTPQQRMWFYETYHPVAKGEETITYCNGMSCDSTHHPLVQIADGRVIQDPNDLAPLVAPDSHTLGEAARADRAYARQKWWGLLFVGGLVGGLYIAAGGHEAEDSTQTDIGVGIAIGSVLVSSVAAYMDKHTVHDARASAFAWYPHDLAERLHVCWNGVQSVPCESVTPGAAPERPVDPNLDQLRPR